MLIDRLLKALMVGFWVVVLIGTFIAKTLVREEDFAKELGMPRPSNSEPWMQLVVGGMLFTALCTFLRHANLRAVRIIDADAGMAELRIARADFAKEFAELNQFHWHDKPFKQRYSSKR